jgi:hypothetical protein
MKFKKENEGSGTHELFAGFYTLERQYYSGSMLGIIGPYLPQATQGLRPSFKKNFSDKMARKKLDNYRGILYDLYCRVL